MLEPHRHHQEEVQARKKNLNSLSSPNGPSIPTSTISSLPPPPPLLPSNTNPRLFLSINSLPSNPTAAAKKLNPLHPNIYSGGSSSKSRNCGSSSRSHGDNDGDRGDSHAHNDDDDDTVFDEDDARKHRVVQDSSDGAAFRELARSILKFGEVYERIESSKQQQMMELERQRMEFTKDLEFQRMQMFMGSSARPRED